MKAVIVWKRETEYGREVEDWLNEFERRTGKEIESLDPESISGENFARIYDVVEYPTILGLDDSGKVLDFWRGKPLPRFDEVAYYAAEKKFGE